MPALETLHIDLPADMAATVRQAVRNGEYASQSDAVQEAIRFWAHDRRAPTVNTIEELRALWNEAIESDTDSLDPDEVFDRLEAKYQALADAERNG